ncbi:hypothetical protein B0J17DRAFT_648940 [Rhizoctonia solani]|nr:hypothetical protein B0J17DRAFT_648940 [Rhizoctonia solani]
MACIDTGVSTCRCKCSPGAAAITLRPGPGTRISLLQTRVNSVIHNKGYMPFPSNQQPNLSIETQKTKLAIPYSSVFISDCLIECVCNVLAV